MKVLFFAYIRDYTRSKETEFEHCIDVEELIHKLCDRYGKKFTAKVLKGEELSDEIIILVNGRNIIDMDGIKTQLYTESTISIFPVVAGG